MSVFVEKGGDKIPAVVGCVRWKFGGREELGALENQVAEMLELAGFPWGDSAVSDGGGEFGEKAVDFRVGDQGAGGGGEFAGEIGGAKDAMRGARDALRGPDAPNGGAKEKVGPLRSLRLRSGQAG
jgi:hypothetical protein